MVVEAVCRTYRAHLALGSQTIQCEAGTIVRCDEAPLIHDVNHVQPSAAATLDATLGCLEESLGHLPFRHVLTDPRNRPDLIAGLMLQDYQPTSTLQMILRDQLAGPPAPLSEIRPVDSEADWMILGSLLRANHLETDARRKTSIYSEALSAQFHAAWKRSAPPVRFFLAWLDGTAVGFCSSWPGLSPAEGEQGLGMVEDLYTSPSHRRRGIARALIHRCVTDARARGADATLPILIGADPSDTPKGFYAALGFRPVCSTTHWIRRNDAPSP